MTTGELESYGFEEVEPYVVEDTGENVRRIRLMEGDWYYEAVLDEDGNPTGLLRVLDPETNKARRESVHERKKEILVDPENPWSDYLGPDEFPLDPPVPYFIHERLAKWKRAEREGIPPEERLPFPRRCETIRHDETRCWNWASNPDKLPRCKSHAGWVNEERTKVRQYAKQRLVDMTLDAVLKLGELSQTGDTDTVKLKASTEILDRAGVKGGTENEVHVEVDLTAPASAIQEKLDQLATRTTKKHELESRSANPPAQQTVQGEVILNEQPSTGSE